MFTYQPVVCLTDQGPISQEVLLKVYNQQWQESEGELSFSSLNDLQKFSYLLLKKLGLKKGLLLSQESYNKGIQEVNNIEGFPEIFSKYGDVVAYEANSKKNFLRKIFH